VHYKDRFILCVFRSKHAGRMSPTSTILTS
jgi:hypothetical protein